MRNRIYELRQQKNLTQKELAKKLNINHSVLSRIETNERPIKDDELLKIADFFNVSTDYLLGRSSNPNPSHKTSDNFDDDFQRPEIKILARKAKSLTPEQLKAVQAVIDSYERDKKRNEMD